MTQGGERIHVIVTGVVQGVWFRAETQRVAQDLEVVGWVKNRPDGSVELEAEGRPESLEELLAWLRDGPPTANVEALDVAWIDARETEKAFAIER